MDDRSREVVEYYVGKRTNVTVYTGYASPGTIREPQANPNCNSVMPHVNANHQNRIYLFCRNVEIDP